jgi:hypothetical protein
MSEMQIARANIASHVSMETTRQFDVALHDAATDSIKSMADLHDAVIGCVKCLRSADIGPVQMILAMKACALDSAGRYHPENNEYPATNVDILMDQIVRWSIAEYYNNVS